MTGHSLDRHVRWYQMMVRITPRGHRERFGSDQVTLFADMLRSGESRARVWARATKDLLVVLTQHRKEVAGRSTRMLLAITSAAPIVAGAWLSALLVDEWGDLPASLGLIATALFLQGVYTLLWLSGRFEHWDRTATTLFVIGETAAVLGGIMVVAAGPIASDLDPEYGVTVIAAAVAVHGMLGLLAFFTGDEANDTATV